MRELCGYVEKTYAAVENVLKTKMLISEDVDNCRHNFYTIPLFGDKTLIFAPKNAKFILKTYNLQQRKSVGVENVVQNAATEKCIFEKEKEDYETIGVTFHSLLYYSIMIL